MARRYKSHTIIFIFLVGGIFENFADYKRAFKMATREVDGVKGTLVIDVQKSADKIEEKVFWYRHKFKYVYIYNF